MADKLLTWETLKSVKTQNIRKSSLGVSSFQSFYTRRDDPDLLIANFKYEFNYWEKYIQNLEKNH